jgi:hypothetical protein
MATFPQVNGQYFSWSDVEATFTTPTGQPFTFLGFKAINYKGSLSKQKVRGNAATPLGTTKGKYEATGDVELFLPQANLLITTMGPGWMQLPITFQVSYVSSGPGGVPADGLPQSVITDTIPPCYLTEIDASQSESDEALTRKFTLTIPGVLKHNGIPDIVEPALLIATA